MINLIRNEFIKLFKKKSIYILLVVMFGFIVLNNFLTKEFSTAIIDGSLEEANISYLKEEMKTLDKSNPDEKAQYYTDLSEIETYELTKKYKEEWKVSLINLKLRDIIYNMNFAKYINNDKETYNKAKKEYDKFLSDIEKNDWKFFANNDKKQLENEIKNLNAYKKEADKEEQKSIDEQIKENKEEIQKIELRLEKNIPYSESYLEEALTNYKKEFPSYEEYKKSLIKEEKKEISKKDEYKTKNKYIEEATTNAKSKYMLDNKTNLDDAKTLRNTLINTINDNFIFIIIIIASVAGVIVSSEFDKGTIKLLLVRPYSRKKILLSKYIVSLLTILIAIVSAIIMQLIVGGIFFGFESLSVPVIVYNFTQNKIMNINVFKYILDNIIAILPQFILLATLGFTISVITNVSTLGVAIPIVGCGAADIINSIAILKNVEPLKYFVTLNWNFSNYLYGGVKSFRGLSLPFSLLICIIYLLIMLIVSFVVFKKRNIKNI